MADLRIYGVGLLLTEAIELCASHPDNAELRDATEDYAMSVTNFMANGYNAAVSYGSGRGPRKMGDFIDAINYKERAEGRVELEIQKVKGFIDSYKPCPPECCMRPGGLFHAADCENDFNSEVSRARQERVREACGDGLRYSPSLVGAGGGHLASRHWAER